MFGRHAADLRQSRLQGGDTDRLPSRGGSAGIQDVGQHRPVLLEICWVPGYWLKQDSDVNFVLDQALRWHVSSVNIKLSAIPAQWKKEFKGIPKENGLSFHLAAAGVPHVVHRGQMMPVHMWRLKRRGSAGVSRIHAEPTRLAAVPHRRLIINPTV